MLVGTRQKLQNVKHFSVSLQFKLYTVADLRIVLKYHTWVCGEVKCYHAVDTYMYVNYPQNYHKSQIT